MTPVITRRFDCRVCKATKLGRVFSFGPTPLANAFLRKDELDLPEAFYPLDVYFCPNCTMLQLGHVVSPELLFSDYIYVSSTSPVFINHFKEFARSAVSHFKLNKESLVIDIGSNDGILLKPFREEGVKILGIEPAKHIAKIAQDQNIETISEFLSKTLARKIAAKYGKAKLVTATNVFAHIDDLDEFLGGLKDLLDKDGVFMIEAPYLIDFLEKKYFDLVYHEHLSYWSVRSLTELFKRFDMEIFDVQKVIVHGGSIRVFVKKKGARHVIKQSVERFLTLEKKKRLHVIETYVRYKKDILKNRVKLMSLVTKLKLSNKTVVGYGAPAKGNTLLNYFKIGNDILDYIVDDSSFKQGLFTPGTHIPVVSPSHLKERRPDYVLLLAWNFADSIMEKYSWFKKGGGSFIIPVSRPAII